MPETREAQKAAITHIRTVILGSEPGDQFERVFVVEDIKKMSDLAILTTEFIKDLYFTPDPAPGGLRLPTSQGVRRKLLQFNAYREHR